MTFQKLLFAILAMTILGMATDGVFSSVFAEPMKEVSGTITSVMDPGVGHESHQLAILLAPSEDVYSGILSYSASEPIQLVALHGPLAEGEDMGQAIWTPDGETKFALTLVDPGNSMGTWEFSGNALAVHTMGTEPMTISYSVTDARTTVVPEFGTITMVVLGVAIVSIIAISAKTRIIPKL